MWLMEQEVEDAIELEKLKVQTLALSSHPATQSDFLKKVFELGDETEEEFSEQNIEWKMPQTEEELAELQRYLENI